LCINNKKYIFLNINEIYHGSGINDAHITRALLFKLTYVNFVNFIYKLIHNLLFKYDNIDTQEISRRINRKGINE